MPTGEVLSTVCHVRVYVVHKQECRTSMRGKGNLPCNLVGVIRAIETLWNNNQVGTIANIVIPSHTKTEPAPIQLASFDRLVLHHSLGHLHACAQPSQPVSRDLDSSINRASLQRPTRQF